MIDEREVQELREQLAQQNLRLHGVERKFPVWAQNRGISRERHMHDLTKHINGDQLHTHDAMLFAQGTYTGDGTASKAITGLGFTPKVVVTKANDNTINDANAVLRTSNMPTSRTITSAADSLDGILSFNADGFTVKHEASATQGKTNVSGKTYYWYAFGGDRVVVGNYTGNGVSGKAVVGIGFAPQMVWIQIRGTGSGTIHRTKSMGTEDYSFASDLGSTNRTLSLDADGFTLGTNTDVNANAGVYDYIAWGLAENFDEGTYTGDGTDDRNLPSPPLLFNPLLAHIKPDAGHPPHFKIATLTGDNSMDYSATLSEANNIQSLSAAQGTFQVGTDITGVNANGVTYYYFAVGSASGTASLIVEEDGAIVDANVSVLDFIEPDGTLVTSSPAGEANVNMALYAKLAGRAGGQTLIGGTATGNTLVLTGNSFDANTLVRVNHRLGINVAPTNAVMLALDQGSVAINPTGTAYDMETLTITGTLSKTLATYNALRVPGTLSLGGFNITSMGGLTFAPTIQATVSASTISTYTGTNMVPTLNASGGSLVITNANSLTAGISVNNASVTVTSRRILNIGTPVTIGPVLNHAGIDLGNHGSAGTVATRSIRVVGSAASVHGPNLGLGNLLTNTAYSPAVTLTSDISNAATSIVYTSAGDPIVVGDYVLLSTVAIPGTVEAILVTAVNTGTNTLTVIRGQLGTGTFLWTAGDVVDLTKILSAPADTLHLFSGGIRFPSVGQLKDSAGIARVEIVTDGRPGGSTPFTQAATINDAGGISSSDTTFTYLGGEGATAPFFVIGQYILIESEALLITNLNTTTNTLTVTRGVLGTTAASHADGTAITLTKDVRVDINGIVRYDDFVVGDASFLGYSTKEILVKSTLTEPTKTGTGTGNMHLTPQEHQYAASTNFRVEIDTAGNMTPLYTVAEYGTAVTLFADIDFGDTTFGYTSSGDPIAVNDYIKINAEVMLVTARDTVADTITVTRARLDTSAIQHTEGAIIYQVTIVQPHATYRWSDDGGATWDASLIPVHSNQQSIGNNIYIRFTNGFTDPHFVLSDRWDFTAIGTAVQTEMLRADTTTNILHSAANINQIVNTATYAYGINQSLTYTGTTAGSSSIISAVTHRGTTNNAVIQGISQVATVDSANTVSIVESLTVLWGTGGSQAGAITNAFGIRVQSPFLSSAVFPSIARGIYIQDQGHASIGTVTGLRIDSQTAGGTATYNIHQVGTTGVNRLAAPTLIGADASPAAGVALELRNGPLRMAASTNNYIEDSAGNRHITFASDTTVVSVTTSFAGDLRINDQLAVGGAVQAGSRANFAVWQALGAGSHNMVQVNLGGTQSANATRKSGLGFIGSYDLNGKTLTNFDGVFSKPVIDDLTGGGNVLAVAAAVRTGLDFGTGGVSTITDSAQLYAIAPANGPGAYTTHRGVWVADQGMSVGGGTTIGLDIVAQTDPSTAATATRSIRVLGSAVSIHEPAMMVGATSAPTAKLHVQEATAGNEIFRLESLATNDDPRESVYQNRVATTDATVTTIQTVAIPTDTVVFIEAKIVARRTGGTSVLGATGDGGGWVVRNAYRNVGGTVTEATVTVGTEADFESLHTATWGTPDMAVSGTNAIVRVTGAADTNITWHATVRTWQVAS